MNFIVAAVLALALLGAAPAPAPLIAGSIRDQHGLPVAGARVTVLDRGHVVGSTRSADDGTFVFDGSGTLAEISCPYCRPLRVPIGDDGLAIAVVVRYDAVRLEGPSTQDIAHLSYAGPAALLPLVPFVVVNETARTVPGLTATDRNATPYGGLLVLDGAQDYDITANVTPFDTLPQGGSAQLSVQRVDQAYRYGDVAQAGTFAFTTTGGDSHVSTGTNTLARAGFEGTSVQAAASYANATVGIRADRAAANLNFQSPGTSGFLTLSSGAGNASPNGASALSSSFSSAVGEIRSRSGIDTYAHFSVDRGTYGYTSLRFPESATWSDTDFEAGITSHASFAPFANFDIRQSSGGYDSYAIGADGIAGSLSRARAAAGIAHHSEMFDAVVAFGNTSVRYAGILGPARRTGRQANDGVISATYRPASHWSLHASTSTGYTLQTFLGIYVPSSLGYPYQPVMLGHTNEAIVEYTDSSRVRIDATALSWSGEGGVATSSAGAAVAWQVAPNVSLRTWVLHETASLWSSGTVANTWLTFANAGAFRADIVWGRSLLDRSPHGHLDASVSGRLSDRIDWFAASANVRGTQEQTAGIRIH